MIDMLLWWHFGQCFHEKLFDIEQASHKVPVLSSKQEVKSSLICGFGQNRVCYSLKDFNTFNLH